MGFGMEAGVCVDGEMFSGERVGVEEIGDEGVTKGITEGGTE